jgi:hypothetical protein
MSDAHTDPHEYRAAIRGIAESAEMTPDSVQRIERQLQRAFSEFHAGPARFAPPAAGRWHLPWWSAAAAALAIAILGVYAWRAHSAVDDRAASSATVADRSPAVATSPPAPSGTGTAVPAATGSATASTMPASRPAVHRKRDVPRPAIRRFVALPGSSALPEFESGAIVRMEVPVSSLPAYGIDISPAAGGQPIEADVLVGQDGQPRAIRLVTNSARSTQ